ncbi:MAG: primase-like DNA-binding domain-containing protein [Gammaproteobacteria bacterium]
MAQFVDDACETGTDCRATSAKLYTRYQGWAMDAGVRRQLNRNNFTGRLKRLGYASGRRTSGARMIAGGGKPRQEVGSYGAVKEGVKCPDLSLFF